MSRINNIIIVIIINLIILVVLLKIVDLLFKPSPPEIIFTERTLVLTEYPANEQFSFTPSDKYMLGTQNLEQKEYIINTDRSGYIIGPKDVEKNDKNIDIVFMGGSTTECMLVDEQYRFPYLVSHYLSDLIGDNIVTRNAGVTGRNSMHSNLDFISRIKGDQPKMVVIMHNINDLAQLLYIGSYFDGPASRRILAIDNRTQNHRGLIYTFLFHVKELVFPNIYQIVSNLIFGSDENDEWSGWRVSEYDGLEQISAEFRNSLKKFITTSKLYNIDVVLMTQFNRMNESDSFIVETATSGNRGIPPFLFEYYHQFNQIIREVSESEEVLLIDLAEKIPSTSEYIYDAVHLNTEGSKLVADVISNKLYKYKYNEK